MDSISNQHPFSATRQLALVSGGLLAVAGTVSGFLLAQGGIAAIAQLGAFPAFYLSSGVAGVSLLSLGALAIYSCSKKRPCEEEIVLNMDIAEIEDTPSEVDSTISEISISDPLHQSIQQICEAIPEHRESLEIIPRLVKGVETFIHKMVDPKYEDEANAFTSSLRAEINEHLQEEVVKPLTTEDGKLTVIAKAAVTFGRFRIAPGLEEANLISHYHNGERVKSEELVSTDKSYQQMFPEEFSKLAQLLDERLTPDLKAQLLEHRFDYHLHMDTQVDEMVEALKAADLSNDNIDQFSKVIIEANTKKAVEKLTACTPKLFQASFPIVDALIESLFSIRHSSHDLDILSQIGDFSTLPEQNKKDSIHWKIADTQRAINAKRMDQAKPFQDVIVIAVDSQDKHTYKGLPRATLTPAEKALVEEYKSDNPSKIVLALIDPEELTTTPAYMEEVSQKINDPRKQQRERFAPVVVVVLDPENDSVKREQFTDRIVDASPYAQEVEKLKSNFPDDREILLVRNDQTLYPPLHELSDSPTLKFLLKAGSWIPSKVIRGVVDPVIRSFVAHSAPIATQLTTHLKDTSPEFLTHLALKGRGLFIQDAHGHLRQNYQKAFNKHKKVFEDVFAPDRNPTPADLLKAGATFLENVSKEM